MLIILLMFAPLRSVFAGQLVCDMKMSMSKAASVVDDVTVDKAVSAQHCQYMMDSAPADERVEYQVLAKSCCDDDGACSVDCHSVVSISLFMQDADYSSALLSSVTFDNISSALLVRELIPPSRPPLSLYS